MINNDDRNKHEEQDEGEYHFSDEEVNYDVESESAKEAPSLSKPGILDRLNAMSRSKRMLLSLLVFLGLVFVVYRMVAPTTTVAPSTDITPVAQAPLAKPIEATSATPQPVTAAPVSTVSPSPVIQVTSPVPAAPTQTGQLPAAPTAPSVPAVSAVPSTLPPPGSGTITQGVITPVQPTVASQPLAQTIQVPPSGASTVVTSATSPAVVQTTAIAPNLSQPTTAIPVSTTVTQQPTVTPGTIPGVIPAQTPMTPLPSGQSPPVAVAQAPASLPGVVLQADLDKAVAQIGTEYGQRINTYADQAKDLQDKMQTLNTRVANIENQMNQLIRIMTRQAEEGANSTSPAPASQVSGQRIPYNVQAIIPGRAWLRSDNGETVTVAEGDSIKNLGRVTKIDPYDGIVEINTGTKTLTLTYGNGG